MKTFTNPQSLALAVGLVTVGIASCISSFLVPIPLRSSRNLQQQLNVSIQISELLRQGGSKPYVGPKEAGLLTALYVDKGAAQGQVLARMDTSRAVHEVAEAKAAVD